MIVAHCLGCPCQRVYQTVELAALGGNELGLYSYVSLPDNRTSNS